MTKLVFALAVLGMFALIFVVKRVGSGAKRAWTEANSLADRKLNNEKSGHTAALPQIGARSEKQDRAFREFMSLQTILLNIDGQGVYLKSDEEKHLYLHFIAGAADRLSRTIADQQLSEEWFHLATGAHGVSACGERFTFEVLPSYGQSGNEKYFSAGKAGWDAMQVFLMAGEGEVTKREFELAMMSLMEVVRQQAAA